MDEDNIKEIRKHLETAHLAVLDHLTDLFGDYKKTPDDHPLWKAVEAIEKTRDLLPLDEEEEDEDEAHA